MPNLRLVTFYFIAASAVRSRLRNQYHRTMAMMTEVSLSPKKHKSQTPVFQETRLSLQNPLLDSAHTSQAVCDPSKILATTTEIESGSTRWLSPACPMGLSTTATPGST